MILGLFYVIEGFLDVSLPTEEVPTGPREAESATLFTPIHDIKPSKPSDNASKKSGRVSKHLFTVKAGGIAGYFCEHTQTSQTSYLDAVPFHSVSLRNRILC